MSVCCECCVFSGRGLCDGLITRREESYRLLVSRWLLSRNLVNEETLTHWGVAAPNKKIIHLIPWSVLYERGNKWGRTSLGASSTYTMYSRAYKQLSIISALQVVWRPNMGLEFVQGSSEFRIIKPYLRDYIFLTTSLSILFEKMQGGC